MSGVYDFVFAVGLIVVFIGVVLAVHGGLAVLRAFLVVYGPATHCAFCNSENVNQQSGMCPQCELEESQA